MSWKVQGQGKLHISGTIDLGERYELQLRGNAQSEIKIQGIDLYFPFGKPYPQQEKLIEKVIDCIQKGKNCML